MIWITERFRAAVIRVLIELGIYHEGPKPNPVDPEEPVEPMEPIDFQ